MKLVVTGGHLTTALAFIQESIVHGDRILFLGRKYSNHISFQETREKAEVENLGCSFAVITAPKLHRNKLGASFLLAPLLGVGFAQSLKHLRAFRPDCVVSFGSYLALPVVLAAKFLNIPIITHEQTRTVGLANQVISAIADKIAIAWDETGQLFPAQKTVVTGNPLRKELFQLQTPKPHWLKQTPKLPILYITGGNLGSQAINQAVLPLLPELTKSHTVIHQSGETDFNQLKQNAQILPHDQQSNYYLRSWFTATEVAWIIKNSKFVISRSGANTVYEIAAVGLPAIFIPLPFSHHQEQLKNAQVLEAKKAALILLQKNLSPISLLNAMQTIEANYTKIKNAAKTTQSLIITTASQKLYEQVTILAQKKKKTS